MNKLMMVCVLMGMIANAKAEEIAPIKAVAGVQPKVSVFEVSSATKPLVLSSEKEAAEHFDKEQLANLMKEVDFRKQVVLVFAWRGSGEDKLDYTVAESLPEQVTFTRTFGLTRDKRPHVQIYALRSNVKWSAN